MKGRGGGCLAPSRRWRKVFQSYSDLRTLRQRRLGHVIVCIVYLMARPEFALACSSSWASGGTTRSATLEGGSLLLLVVGMFLVFCGLVSRRLIKN